MKIFWIIISIGSFLTPHSVFAEAEDESTDFCNQQLIQASASCLTSKTLENCISDFLKEGGCEIEIVTEENIHVCNEECAPDLSAVLFNEEKNILPLTEGE